MAGVHEATTVRSDAQSRALNTLWQGFGVDALVLIGLGITELLHSGDPTSGAFWATIAVLVIKSFLTAAAGYMVRLKFPAATATPDTPAATIPAPTPAPKPAYAPDPADDYMTM